MPFGFTDPARYPYRDGGFFLGADDQGREVGISTERHLMTVAGARSGKGAALIVPNLKRWQGSAVVIDPKGENATLTAMDRAAMGQSVGILDPYRIVSGDAARFRCSINPLAGADPASLHLRADLEALADGLIMRHDPKHEAWVRAARQMVAGMADFLVATEPPESWTLPNVREAFLQPPDALEVIAEKMLSTATPARIAKDAGALLLEKLNSPESIPAQTFASSLLPALSWIGDPAFDDVWQGLPPFNPESLKAGNGTLFLVLPPKAIGPRGTFLRLFVTMALNAMMSDLHAREDARCLFLLDEFYSLGSLDLVAQAMGLMGGYGVSLWPFLQDLGQLKALYGEHLTDTFFSNTDAQVFFGNTDAGTLNTISMALGVVQPEEIGDAPVGGPGTAIPITGATIGALVAGQGYKHSRTTGAMIGGAVGLLGAGLNAMDTAAHQMEMNEYNKKAMTVGRPRVSADQIRETIGKKDGDTVARGMIVFAKGSDVLLLHLSPYFDPITPTTFAPASQSTTTARKPPALLMIGGGAALGAIWGMVKTTPPDDPAAVALLGGVGGAIAGLIWYLIERRRQKRG